MGWICFVDNALSWGSRRMVSAAVMVCLGGMTLTVLAFALHLSPVRFDGNLVGGAGIPLRVEAKEVGYVSALNWSLYSVVVMPFVVAFCLKMRADMGETVRKLAANRMVRTEDFSPISVEDFHARWIVDRRSHAFILTAVVAAGLAAVAWDWFNSVAQPLAVGLPSPPPALSDGEFDYDWSLAPLMAGSQVNVVASQVFTALAYLMITCLSTALGLAAMIDALFFVAFACGLTQSAQAGDGPTALPRTWRLTAMPDKEGDNLCGFGVFAPFFSSLFCAAIAILVGLQLMMIQNAYLRDPTSGSIAQFFADDALGAVGAVGAALAKFDAMRTFEAVFLKEDKMFVIGFNSVLGLSLFLFVVVLCVFASWTVLYKSAEAARDHSRNHAAQLARETRLARSKVTSRLDQMRFWPLGWLSLTSASLVMVFMLASVVSYRLMLLPFVAVGLILLARMAALFARQLAAARH